MSVYAALYEPLFTHTYMKYSNDLSIPYAGPGFRPTNGSTAENVGMVVIASSMCEG